MPKRQWNAESNGKLPHLFIPNKTATLVPEFAVEDLPSVEHSLGSCSCSEGPTLGQNTLMMMMMYCSKAVCFSIILLYNLITKLLP